MEAWPGSGSSVCCLLDKQAPGSGGVVDAYGAGDAPALFLILFVYTHKRTALLLLQGATPATSRS